MPNAPYRRYCLMVRNRCRTGSISPVNPLPFFPWGNTDTTVQWVIASRKIIHHLEVRNSRPTRRNLKPRRWDSGPGMAKKKRLHLAFTQQAIAFEQEA